MRALGLSFTILIAFNIVNADEGAEEHALTRKVVTIDGAFRFEGQLFLISGDEYMAITDDGFEKYVRERGGETHVPIQVPITAASTWPGDTRVYYWSTTKLYKVGQPEKTLLQKTYGPARQFMVPGGPDAVSFKNGWSYVFKGCQYVTQKGTLWHLSTSPQNLEDVGLPCNIDAAWIDKDFKGMTILKGDKIWHWGETVEGPEYFAEKYHIWSWQLQPHPDDRFQL